MKAPRLMFVHAHPDDESSKGAATAARYADVGVEVILVIVTGGEAGDVLNPAYGEVHPHDMPVVRAAELEEATKIIGFTRVHLLGERDSGYHEDLDEVPDDTFWRAPLDRPATRLAAIIRQERPHVVATYPADGGYPHPDHIRTHTVTMAAVEMAADEDVDIEGVPTWDVPRTVYVTGFPRERTMAIHEAMHAAGVQSPYAEWIDRIDERGPRDVDAIADVRIDVAAWFSRRDDALRAHATQVDPAGAWFAVPRDLEAEIFPWETYCLLRGDPYPDGATDLFEGLDPRT